MHADLANKPIQVVDLFCGVGGLAYGLRSSGMHLVAGVDLDPACAFPFTANCGGVFHQRSVADLSAGEVATWFAPDAIRVLVGCAPCQPFSTYARTRRSSDSRWTLLRDFLRIATGLRPDYVSMENVAGLAREPVWAEFVSALRAEDYTVESGVLACAHFGVPQTRKRLVLVASSRGRVRLPSPLINVRSMTVRDAIGHDVVERLEAGERSLSDPLHAARALSELNLARIRASKPGGSWRDWPEALRATCHRQASGSTYPSVYGRMEWDRPAPTITTQCFGLGNGRFGHPAQDRAITLREAALLQSFPLDYAFAPEGAKLSHETLGGLIGNAVPPKLGEAIGRSLLAHLSATDDANAQPPSALASPSLETGRPPAAQRKPPKLRQASAEGGIERPTQRRRTEERHGSGQLDDRSESGRAR